MKEKNESRLQFSVGFEGQPKEPIQVTAFLFDKSGNHLQTAPVNEKGNFELNVSEKEMRNLQLFIAPTANEKQIPSIAELEKAGAYQPYLHAGQLGKNGWQLQAIPEFKYQYWWMCNCRVTGRVTKTVFNGGALQVLPVCKARVHICEVDRWRFIISKIPKDILYRIKDELIIDRRWPEPPVPDPGPIRELNIPVRNLRAAAKKSALRIAATEANDKAALANDAVSGINSLKLKLNRLNTEQQLRQELAGNFHLIYPYICWWRWFWPWFYSCDEKAVIITDEQGRFAADIKYWCFGDRPDIYVWVDYLINGQWVTVYNPGRACHTRWNYECGSDININITDSRVAHCGRTDVIGEIVEILSIGTGAYSSHILQRSVMQTVQGVSFNARGLTDLYLGGLSGIRYANPFGETLNVEADFGSTLHTSAVTHFKCSYKRSVDADIASNWTALNGPLLRFYQDEIYDGVNPPFKQNRGFDLKDATYEDLYIIPNHEASAQAGIPAPAGTLINRDWVSLAFTIAIIDSTKLVDDLYDFKFELYKINAGTPQRVSVPRSTFQVPNPDDVLMSLPLSNTAYSSSNYPDFHAEDYIIPDGGSNAFGFKMTFRVNNDTCSAVIDNIMVINNDGTTTDSDTECGFAQYKDKATSKVKFSFEASHPENFATFSFDVIRGNGNPCPDADTGGMVIGSSSNGYTLSGGKYTKEVPAANLLGNCTQAAFSENLYVAALATNGSRRLWEYDRSDVAAFAIEPL
ncbi:MAG: hypothetical protein QM687_04400 [Ferruginibacter sp.]